MTEDSGERLAPGLYLLPTPLGNLGDLSQRIKHILEEASLVAAEDTRRSLKLLNFLKIKKPILSYREENHHKAWPRIREALLNNQVVALLTDAGSPLVSDPGAKLVREARAEKLPVFPVPGPSAVITALMASGLSMTGFSFLGFPPPRKGKRRAYFETFKDLEHPLVIFEAPHRLRETLEDLLEVMGDRTILLCREMTKVHEEYLELKLSQMLAEVTKNPRKGEVTLVLEGLIDNEKIAPKIAQTEESILSELKRHESLILADPRAQSLVAKDWAQRLGAPRQLVYRLIASLRGKL